VLASSRHTITAPAIHEFQERLLTKPNCFLYPLVPLSHSQWQAHHYLWTVLPQGISAWLSSAQEDEVAWGQGKKKDDLSIGEKTVPITHQPPLLSNRDKAQKLKLYVQATGGYRL
jgi:hypothetical protein